MDTAAYVNIRVMALSDIFYNLEQAAMELRAAMDMANSTGEYGREAKLGDMLTHVLLALASLPPKNSDLPF